MCLLTIISFLTMDFGVPATEELQIVQILNLFPLIITLIYYSIGD